MARLLKDYPEVSLNCEDLHRPIDFEQVFGRDRPVHIEVGVGKGTFLVGQAKQQLELNFLGIEWARKYYRYAVDRVGRWGLRNVRVVRAEAAGFIAEYVPSASVDCFHVYFPDPWPKKRHHKRRFICPSNLDQMIRCLTAGGSIQIVTDHTEYFEQIKACVSQKKHVLREIEFVPAAGVLEGECVGTNYERKYVKQQRQVHTIAVRKIVGGD
jgi:tRNA (guanine-N7-)-methyltransferase